MTNNENEEWVAQRNTEHAMNMESLACEIEEAHKVYGLFYSMYKEEVWAWDLLVAGRKILIAMIGVFGGALNVMQVHLTIIILLAVILLTSSVRPFGGKRAIMLHYLEILSLTSTFLTLWAGSIFNSYPRCEDPNGRSGRSLPWCNALSIVTGGINIVCVIMFAAAYVTVQRSEKEEAPLPLREESDNVKKKEKTGNEKTDDGAEELGLELTPMQQGKRKSKGERKSKSSKKGASRRTDSQEVKNVLVEGAWERHQEARSGMWYRYNSVTGATVWETAQEVNVGGGGGTADGGADGGAGAGGGAGGGGGADDEPTHHSRSSTQMPDGWNKHSDDLGRRYYANNDGVTQWVAPEGATGGSAGDASSFSALDIDDERENSTVVHMHSHPRQKL